MLNYRHTISFACLIWVYVGCSVAAWAQTTSVSTVPSGYFTLTIPAGTGNGSSATVLCFPLQGTASASGQMSGVITGITANTITNGNAGWTSAQLS
ncbi:MAG TPA: hypothetical protein VGC39_06095, partial [Candidatus Methylacidiphilales bacterium]